MLKKVLLIWMCLSILLSIPVAAASSNYTIVEGDTRVAIAEAYMYVDTINNPLAAIGEKGFSSPQDIFINNKDEMYCVDTGNNRIVKMTTNGQLIDVFKGSEKSPFQRPMGIWVEENGDMYIADTGNSRIVQLSADGSFVREYRKPKSDLLDADFIFDPTKVVLSPTGQIYALKGQYLVCMDEDNNFRGYVGQSKISYSLSEVIVRLFGSEKQKSAIRTRIAASYTNIFMDKDGMIYATTLDAQVGEIKKLNAVGENVYKNYGSGAGGVLSKIQSAIGYRFDDLSFSFGDRALAAPEMPNFQDITVDAKGIITAIESVTGKLFQYDSEGNLLCVFGGLGSGSGAFTSAVSIANDSKGNIYVLDSAKNNIQIFSPTSFAQIIHFAVEQYDNGDYLKAAEYWEKALEICENYSAANNGLALAAYQEGDYETAMKQYAIAGDRLGYSDAYYQYRTLYLRDNFFWVLLVLVAVLVLLVLLFKLMARASKKAREKHLLNLPDRFSMANTLLCSLGVAFHPVDTLSSFKNSRKRTSPIAGMAILLAVFVIRIVMIYSTHYPLVSLEPRDANLFLEFGKLILPIVTSVIACYLVISIVGGESTLPEIFTTFSMSWTPYIVINFLLTLFSRVMCREEGEIYAFFAQIAIVIPILLMVLSIYLLNNYSFIKTLSVAVLTVIVVILLWIVVLMILGYTVQFYEFLSGLVTEYRMIDL